MSLVIRNSNHEYNIFLEFRSDVIYCLVHFNFLDNNLIKLVFLVLNLNPTNFVTIFIGDFRNFRTCHIYIELNLLIEEGIIKL